MQRNALLALIAVALLGLVYWAMSGDPQPNLPGPEKPGPKKGDAGSPKTKSITGGNAKTGAGTTRKDPVREAVSDNVSPHTESPQGVKGRVVDIFDAPIAGAEVYLAHGMGLNAIQLMRRYQKGERFQPIAATTTGPDGLFKLGLPEWKEADELNAYEIRVLHPEYCDQKVPRIQVQPMDWYDAGNLKLKQGAVVEGTVTDEAGSPIAKATVSVQRPSSIDVMSIPGREDGLQQVTDEAGRYQFRNLDNMDFAGLSAHAEGYAREHNTEIKLAEQSRHLVDFKLAPGFIIEGFVVGPDGEAIPGAGITAAALSRKSPQMETATTAKDGSFFVSGLRAGPFSITVDASGYLRGSEQPINAGGDPITITLEKQGAVRVTVLGKNDAPISNFVCNLKPALEGQDGFGKPLVTKNVRGAQGGTALVEGVNPLTYVAEIIAPNYAKNFSERFTITAAQEEPPEVTIRLNQGGVLRGVVRDGKGEPIAGVRISTMPDGLIEHPFLIAFGGAPYTITRANRVTDQKGAFEFRFLHPGKYQLKFQHDDHCTLFTQGNEAKVNETNALPDTIMVKGCVVTGIARVGGKPSGQVRVHVSAVAEKNQPTSFSTEAVSDNEGRFLLPKRLPPGRYEVSGGQMIKGNPFMIILQMKDKKPFQVSPEQEHLQLTVDVKVIK